jgi:hypothetical protein
VEVRRVGERRRRERRVWNVTMTPERRTVPNRRQGDRRLNIERRIWMRRMDDRRSGTDRRRPKL